jgi:toxin ParE1/3/4
MTGRSVLTPRAQTDLDEIWDYTVGRWGLDQAETYARQLWDHIKMVAARPAIGRECPELRPGYYKYPSGSHVLFYRLITDGIDVVRILHERMDYDSQLP